MFEDQLRKLRNNVDFKFRLATSQYRPLPDFLVIGAQKSGTSSLNKYLNQHPLLFSSSIKNEIHFFDSGIHTQKRDNYERGEAWYRAHFPLQWSISKESRVFETTPLYIFHPFAAERIHKMIPEIKLVALLRNPTERAISHYFMVKRKYREPLPMLEAFQMEERRQEELLSHTGSRKTLLTDYSYKARGCYAAQLATYYKFFPKDHILLLKSEDFFDDPIGTLKQVFAFVDVNPDFKVTDLSPRNSGKEKFDITPGAREYLDGYFRPHNLALYDLTGIDFGW